MQRPPKPSPLEAIFFDWDGTLIDSYHADAAAYMALFRDFGIRWGLDELHKHYSPDWYRVYREAGIPRRDWTRADKIWRAYYAHHRPKLLPGARSVLLRLAKRHRLGLVTSGDRSRVVRQLHEYSLAALFESTVCGDDTRRRKPHPEPLLRALREMKLKPASCIYIGDTPEDLQMARAAGMPAIAVLGPFPTAARLRAAKPAYLLNSVKEVPALLRKLREPQ